MTRTRDAMSRPDEDAPITLELIEKCLDRLAVIMAEDPEHAPRMVPIYERLEEEAAVLRRREATMQRALERARQVRGKARH